MKRWFAATALLVACSSSNRGPDRCQRAFAKLSSLGIFGGAEYGAEDSEEAIALGTSCGDLTKDDFACIDAAKGKADLDKCTHARDLVEAERDRLLDSGSDGPPTDPADYTALADAVCRCKEVSCLVVVGEEQHDRLERVVSSGKPTDPTSTAALDRAHDCVAGLPDDPRPIAHDDSHDYAGKMHFFADQMCACTTAACAAAVQATESQWEAKVDRDAKPDADALRRIADDAERMAECKLTLTP